MSALSTSISTSSVPGRQLLDVVDAEHLPGLVVEAHRFEPAPARRRVAAGEVVAVAAEQRGHLLWEDERRGFALADLL